jgi:DNA-binding NtrC family response regulator
VSLILKRVLIVDDEPDIRFAVGEFLRTKGLQIYEAENCQAAMESFRRSKPDLIVMDNFLPDGTAIDLLPRFKEADAQVPVLVLTANASIDLAVRAIKEGAEQFITKPVDLNALWVLCERLLEHQRTQRREFAARSMAHRTEINPFLGQSPAIQALREQARRVAAADSAIVIQGETGSGKGVLARWLHQHSARAEEPFVDLNCAGLSRDFLETELFGHEKGAFTSAVQAKPGLLEVANRGTLFLDEIGDIDPLVQPKLLKALEEKRFRRLGEVKDRTVDIRLIAASHHHLAELVQQGKFRSDLYFRINTIPLRVPPLRERKEDVPEIAQLLLDRLCADLGLPPKRLSGGALDEFLRYAWPGNVRELRNVLERAILLGSGDTIERTHLLFDPQAQIESPLVADGTVPMEMSLDDLERWHIERVLNHVHGKVDAASIILKVPRSTLYQKLKQYGLSFRRSVAASSGS